jgi:hypothetical protein
MAVTRPLKEGSVTTYQQKVAAGFPDILASEMDADLDTIYAAWNGGVATANLIDGSVTTAKIGNGQVTYAKLAPDAQLWSDTGTALTPGTNFASRPIVAVPGDANMATVILGSATAKGRVQTWSTGTSTGSIGLFSNRNSATNAQDDATKPSWSVVINPTAGGDNCLIQRAPAGSTTQANLLLLDATGNLTVSGTTTHIFGVATQILPGISSWLQCNNLWGAQNDPAKASWGLNLNGTSDVFGISRRAPAGPSGGGSVLTLDAGGSLIITGPTGQKSTGTTWSNPSDRRLKDDIEDYATGLAAILQLQPRTFVYNGKGGSTAGMRGYGFIADEIAPIMSETVGVRAGKLDPDDEDETDIQTLDQSNLILALVNAVKEVAARVAALETR